MNDESTLGGQIDALMGGDSSPAWEAPAPAPRPERFGEALAATPDAHTLGAEIDALGSTDEFGDDDLAEDALTDPTGNPYQALGEEEQDLLLMAKSPVGRRLLGEINGLIAQHGSADKVLALLDAPVVDENALWQEAWGGRNIQALLEATDEFGDPKYTQEDPLVQGLVMERFERLRDKVSARSTSESPAAQREAQMADALGTVMKMFPSADPDIVQYAMANGGDPMVAARRSHAHVENLMTKTRATSAEANAQSRRNAPQPLRPGNRAPAQSGSPVPDPFKDPRGFAAYERKLIEQGNRARRG